MTALPDYIGPATLSPRATACKAEGCGKSLRADNRLGYCRKHYGKRPASEGSCLLCGRPIKVRPGRTGKCRSCAAKKHEDPRAVRKAWMRTHALARRYWTLDRWDEYWRAQRGGCAICRVAMVRDAGSSDNGATTACADHDHVRRSPRAILCSLCNTSLGSYEKHQRSRFTIERYENYLRYWEAQHRAELVSETFDRVLEQGKDLLVELAARGD